MNSEVVIYFELSSEYSTSLEFNLAVISSIVCLSLPKSKLDYLIFLDFILISTVIFESLFLAS